MLLTALAFAGTEVLPRAPYTPRVGMGEQVVFGPTFGSFTRLELGTPLMYGHRGVVGLGVTAGAAVYHVAVFEEERSHTQLQNLGGGVWALFEPGRGPRHAVGLSAAWSPEPAGWYGLVAQDTVTRVFTVSYRLDHRAPRYRVGIAVDTGIDLTTPLHATLAPTFGVTVVPGFELEATGVLGFQSLAALGMGVRVLAFQGLEIGAGGFMVAGFDRHVTVHGVPQVTVRYQGRWKKRFTRDNPWTEALAE